MKTVRMPLSLMMIIIASSQVLPQSKGEMPFSSSSNANKMLRQSWVALSDSKLDEANNYIKQVLEEDPEFGMAYATLFASGGEQPRDNLVKAEGMKLSADERMLIDGLKASLEKKPTEAFFEPLIKKYPSDYYLQLWIMFTNNDRLRAIEIGENIVKRSPKFAPAYNLLGYYYMDENDMTKAEANFNKYMSLRPELHNVYDSKGDFMMRAGKFEEAVALYEKAAGLGMNASAKKAEHARARLKFPEPASADTGEIKEIVSHAFEAFKDRNVEAFLKDQSEHSVEIFPNQRVNVGRANIRQRVSQNFKNTAILKNDFSLERVYGVGPIALTYGHAQFVVKDNASEKETAEKYKMIFLFRNDKDGKWKFLASHFYGLNEDAGPLDADDRTMIQKLLSDWDDALKPGEILTDTHFQRFSNLYSSQAVEIFPNLISNVGLPNLQARWQNFVGAKMEVNSLGSVGIEGLGRRAIAWGIGKQAFHTKTGQLQQFEFPWAMIFIKDNDDAWRILAQHWGAN